MQQKPKKKHLSLFFDECVFEIMKQRKNRYMKKEKLKELTWNDFIKIRVLCGKC